MGQGPPERGKRARGKADEEELLRNLALIEGKGGLDRDGDADMNDASLSALIPAGDGDEDNDGNGARPEKPTLWEMPHPRFNAQLAVQDDTLYVFGGTFEKGDREYTFDEMFALDLGRLDGWKEVFRRELVDWHGEESEEEDESEEDEEETDDEEGSGEEEGRGEGGRHGLKMETLEDSPGTPATSTTSQTDTTEAAEDSTPPREEDTLPSPRPFESLRDFFARTSTAWQDTVLEAMKYQRGVDVTNTGVKEVRKKAFELAERRWWDVREEVQAAEEEAEEAGIGEVVALEARGAGAEGGGGRRR